MIPGFDLTTFASTTGPWIVVLVLAAIIFAESGLLIGFFLPGDSILFTAGFLIFAGTLNFDIHLLVAILFVAAVLGDSVGYLFGRRIGHKIFRRPDSLLFRQENIKKAEEFYEKHGGITIVVARFIPIIRTFAPIVAGVGKMPYRTFLMFNLAGAFLWAGGVTYAGYYIGEMLHGVGIEVDTILLPIILLIVLASILPPAIHILKDKKQRDAIWNGTKKQIAVILKRK
ncbi:MAG TPA: VTT domain-containing protein [Candidatus Saccharimonadales bacterium]|nr:VTT domain-containing protein [Candidatus Saccharimonadales bacterium]